MQRLDVCLLSWYPTRWKVVREIEHWHMVSSGGVGDVVSICSSVCLLLVLFRLVCVIVCVDE